MNRPARCLDKRSSFPVPFPALVFNVVEPQARWKRCAGWRFTYDQPNHQTPIWMPSGHPL